MCSSRERGNVLVLCFLLVTLLVALSTAHFVTVQKSSRQSTFFGHLEDLRRYCDSGIGMALHELTYRTGGGDGLVGTEAWSAGSDLGRDGRASTADEGERDGIPTPGEPNLALVPIGATRFEAGLLVHTSGTAWPDVRRVVASASSMGVIAAVEVYVRETFHTLPPVGAVFLHSNVSVDVNGNSFDISGSDTNPDGTRGPGGAEAGIATSVGDPAGSNSEELIDQVPSRRGPRIAGSGGSPSIQESAEIDFDTVWGWFEKAPGATVPPGNYSDGSWGDAALDDWKVTRCKGDLELSGGMKGAGVLIVEGNLTLSGRSSFTGVVLVRGDVVVTGGGSGVHLYGTLMVGPSATNPEPSFTISGNSKVLFSSAALAAASRLIPPTLVQIYWNQLK